MIGDVFLLATDGTQMPEPSFRGQFRISDGVVWLRAGDAEARVVMDVPVKKAGQVAQNAPVSWEPVKRTIGIPLAHVGCFELDANGDVEWRPK